MTQEEFDSLPFPCCLMVAWSTHRPVPENLSPLMGLYRVDNAVLDLQEMAKTGMRYPLVRLCLSRKDAENLYEHAKENEDYLFTMCVPLEARHLMDIAKASDALEESIRADRSLIRQGVL